MAKRKTNGASLDGAGSILSTVAGPAAPPQPSRLGPPNPISDQLLEKVTGDEKLAAEMPFNSTKPQEYGEAAYTPHAGETHARQRRLPRPAPAPKSSPPARWETASRTSATTPSTARWTGCAWTTLAVS